MTREDLIKHLQLHGCAFLRERGNHTVYVNRREKKASTVHRHRELDEGLCRKICRDLNIPKP
ncbi:MAG: type II toxin-antitoxin system HicA family toxin [Deltaproteobacteria bacterium]|nr:type II toxin-antitoxin system HicA family toxin [Deltaproteobacteria bacterium]